MASIRLQRKGSLLGVLGLLTLAAPALLAVYAQYAAAAITAVALGTAFHFFSQQARRDVRKQERLRQRLLERQSEPEIVLRRFQRTLDAWDGTVSSLLESAGPAAPVRRAPRAPRPFDWEADTGLEL